MRVLDLFSGIGGFSLGLERAGMRTIQFVECDLFCRAILAQHWPDVPCHDDVRTFHAPAGFADVICGGFPCQDISYAGEGAGLQGERSGLWADFGRLVGEVRPRYVIVENVSALLTRGLSDVLGDLAEIGYDAEWHCIPASAVGAPHRRDRIWIVAYPGSEQHEGRSAEIGRQITEEFPAADSAPVQRLAELGGESNRDPPRLRALAHSDEQGQLQPRGPVVEVWRWLGNGGEEVPYANGELHGHRHDAEGALFSAGGAPLASHLPRELGGVPGQSNDPLHDEGRGYPAVESAKRSRDGRTSSHPAG